MNALQEKIFDVVVAILSTKSLDEQLTGEFAGKQALQHNAIRYGLLNYVAKYSLAREEYLITDKCYDHLESKDLLEDNTLLRGSKGKKNQFTFEHPVPSNVISDLLIAKRDNPEEMRQILRVTDKVTVLTYEENKLFTGHLIKYMPNQEDWQCKNSKNSIFARYIEAGVQIPEKLIKVKGALAR